MPLDPQAKAFLDPLNEVEMPAITSLPVEVVRASFETLGGEAPEEPIEKVENRSFPGPAGDVPIRVYTPEGSGPFPILVYFHGGGFVLCSLDSHDNSCRQIANRAGCVVVSVDYRLAPEAKFPAAPEDCLAATRWASEHASELGGDAARLAVGGDSAGGNLTAAVCLMARESGGPRICHQLLIYPVTNHDFETHSYRENAEGYMLTRETMQWFWSHYLENASDGANPVASPLLAKDFTGLPSATVITAEYDPLRDEGEAYAARLEEAGVAVQCTRYDGMFHGFFAMPHLLDRAWEAIDEAASELRKAFGEA